MKLRLGEMSLGDILSDSFSLLFKNLPKYMVIYFIINIPILIITFIQPIFTRGGYPNAYLIFQILHFGLYYLFLYPLSTAAILKVVSGSYLEEPVSIGSALKFAFSKFGKLLGVITLAGLVILGGYILLIVPGIIFSIWYIFTSQIVVVENIGGKKALGRSKTLTYGFRSRIFSLWVFIAIASYIVGVVAALLPVFLPTYTEGINYLNLTITTLVNFCITTVLIGSFQSIAMTLYYFEIKARKEGFDLIYLSSTAKPAATNETKV
jgi:hypothetical protein